MVISGEGSDRLIQEYVYFQKIFLLKKAKKQSKRCLKEPCLIFYTQMKLLLPTCLELKIPFLDHWFPSYQLSLQPEMRIPKNKIENISWQGYLRTLAWYIKRLPGDQNQPSTMGYPQWRISGLGASLVFSGYESLCQYGEHRFDPCSGEIPKASEQLSPCVTTAGPMRCNCWNPSTWSLRSAAWGDHNEKPEHHSQE